MSFLHNLPYEWVVGLRYTRAGKRSARNGFISFISLISVSGIALGVAALIVVLSVMNGFQKEVTDRMLSVLPHIEIYDARGAMPKWEEAIGDAKRNPAVQDGAPFVETQGMMMYDGVMKPARVRGVLPLEEPKVSDISRNMKQGSLAALKPGEFGIVLGLELAKSLGVAMGDQVIMAVASGQAGEEGMTPRMTGFTVVGVFESGHFEFDSAMSVVHIGDAMTISNLPAPAGIQLRLTEMYQAPAIARELLASMPGELLIGDWTMKNATWFAAVKSQKKMMFIILVLIVAVAAFNLVATLAMTVTDKQADIAILRTLGASPRSIMKIFMIQGALVGIIGTLLGVGFGSLIALNIDVIIPAIERVFGVQFLSKEIYFISTLPSDLRVGDVAGIGGVSIALAFVATLYPSFAAARVKPAEALRYE
jgi:lipoprotein-releasing system permease protein